MFGRFLVRYERKATLMDVNSSNLRTESHKWRWWMVGGMAALLIGVALVTNRAFAVNETVSINDVSVVEGTGGTSNAVFTVTLSGPPGIPTTVNYTTADGTAKAPGDYVPTTTGTVTFGSSETSKTISVPLVTDSFAEPNETFTVIITVPPTSSNVTCTGPGADCTGQATILNDDGSVPSLSINDVTAAESAGTANFTVTLSPTSGQVVTVFFATANGSATAPADYASTTGTVTFAPGVATQTVSVLIVNDGLNEGSETFFVNLSNPNNAAIIDSQGTGTITDNDAQPSISINDITVAEGSPPTSTVTSAVFVVTLSSASGQTVLVDFSTANGTATAPSDYVSSAGTLVFAPGVLTQGVTVTVQSDNLGELDETFFVNLANAVNATISDAQGMGTITNDDVFPAVFINNVTVTEGNTGTTPATFTVTLTATSAQTVTVDYATADGTATAPSDYASATGTVTFAPGVVTQTVSILVQGDTVDEVNETFFVNLSNPIGATCTGGDCQGQGTITDNDGPSLFINDVTVTEGNSGTTPATFTVTMSAASGQTVTVNYATADGTATGGTDYNPTSGTLTFAPGVVTQTVTVTVNSDTIDESNETFFVNLSAPTNATCTGGDCQGQGTITDDDASPTLSINDVSVVEGNSGTTPAVFTITLTGPTGQTVTVNYATADGTATTPSDYISVATTTVTFAPGQTSKQVTITVTGETVPEANETYTVNLSNAVNATISDAQGVGTIVNDDGNVPAISINDVTVPEGTGVTTTATFIVTLSLASGQTVTVDYATANGTATAPSDYTSATGTVTFAPGTTTQTVNISVVGDTLDEPDETFFVNLSNATNATISDAQGVGTITDNDGGPSLSINDVTVPEGTGVTTTATFTITLSATSGQTVTVDYATANGTATAPSDYASVATTTVTFAPGTTTQTVNISVVGDTLDEPDETFFVNLSNATNATISDAQGVGTITDNDGASATLSINDVTVPEGTGVTTSATFTITLSAASGQTVTVDYATANGTATAPADYTSVATTTVTFAPGTTTQTVNISVVGDTLDEPDETFFVNLSNANNATISDAQGVGTITDDDGASATLSINDVTVTEGNAGTTPATFTITLSAASGQTVTVNYATANGTATAPADYTSATTTTVTFAPGTTTQTVNILVQGDTLDEPDETFFVNLSNATNATISDAQGVGTITDNDGASATLSINDVTVPEGTGVTTTATFTITLSAASGQTVTVDYATANGTATAPADYTSVATTTVTFAPGTTTQTVNILIQGDTFPEPNETFTVNLSNATNATISDAQGVGTILNDDGTSPAISINDVTVTEGNAGPTPATFTVTMSAASGQTVTVDYATANGTATAPADYTSATGTVTFAPGATTQTVNILVQGDTVDEVNETFTVNLSNPNNATISDAQGLGTITDDDPTLKRYTTLTPARIFDTRDGTGDCTPGCLGPLGEESTRSVQVTGQDGVPPSGVSAVVINVTVSGPTQSSFLTVYPSDASQPNVSNLNFTPGQTVPNLVKVKLGADGRVKVYNHRGATDVIFDVQGWYSDGTQMIAHGAYTSLDPARIFDTRNGPGTPLGPNQSIDVQVTGEGNVPASGVSAAAINVTVTEGQDAGYLTVYPTGETQPTASNLNYVPLQTVPNLVIAKTGTAGKVTVFNGSAGTVHVVFDVGGWYSDDTITVNGGSYDPLVPARILDTRNTVALAPGEAREVQITGLGGVPGSGVDAVVMNTTITEPGDIGYLTVYPAGTSRPLASNLNWLANQTVPNLVIVRVGTGGMVVLYNGSSASVQVVLDVAGWFDPATT